MNTNPQSKTILCYGDSNTWGRLPDRSGRFDAKTRWTGQLQDLLGNEYYIIEEGLGGRTTDLDDPDSVKNGLTYLMPCIKSHEQLDYVIIMLGTNDFKFRFNRRAEDVAKAIDKLIAVTKSLTSAKILMMSPVSINPHALRFKEFYAEHFDETAGIESSKLAPLLSAIASKEQCSFLDLNDFAQYGEDGLHLDEAGHRLLANELSQVIRSFQ